MFTCFTQILQKRYKAYLDMIGNESFEHLLCTVCECLGDDSKAVTDAGNDDQGDADDNQGD